MNPRSSRMTAPGLTDRQALQALLSLPPNSLTRERLDRLLSLTEYFGGQDPSMAPPPWDEASPGDGDIGGEAPSTRHSRKRPRGGEAPSTRDNHKRPRSDTTPRHPWGPFLKRKTLELAPVYVRHLRKHGTDAIRFLNDGCSLQHRIAHYDHRTVGDAFLSCYQYTQRLEARQTMDRVRWCFTMLMYFDLVKIIRPHGSARVGCLMLEDIKSFLGPVLSQTTLSADLALQQLNEWSRCGYKLSLLCAEFGPGSLFFLQSLLSRDL